VDPPPTCEDSVGLLLDSADWRGYEMLGEVLNSFDTSGKKFVVEVCEDVIRYAQCRRVVLASDGL
jgi:hypothetical protein